jgi:hypothetical protein
MHGNLKEETRGGQANIGFWDSPKDWASWKVNFKQPGKFKIAASCATVHSGVSISVEAAGQKLTSNVPATGDWEKFEELTLGTIDIKQGGEQTLSIRPSDAKTWKAINLRRIVLAPEGWAPVSSEAAVK